MRSVTNRSRAFAVVVALTAYIASFLVAIGTSEQPKTRLIAAVASLATRPVQGRLIGFPFGCRPSTDCGATDSDTVVKLHSVIGRIIEMPVSDRESAHTRAIALLVSGHAARAEALLAAAAANGGGARTWNDLATARIDLARNTDDSEMATSALAAAARAIEYNKALPEAHFNYALALFELGLRNRAAAAFRQYLMLDGSSRWADEARQHLALCQRQTISARWKQVSTAFSRGTSGDTAEILACTFPQQSRTTAEGEYLASWADGTPGSEHWLDKARAIGLALQRRTGESLLARAVASIDQAQAAIDKRQLRALAAGHLEYRRGRILYKERLVRESIDPLASAEQLFASGGSPMRYVAACYRASALYDEGDAEQALSILSSLRERAPASFIALHAQIEWQRALIFSRMGHFHVAIDSLGAAIAAFDTLGETPNATALRSSAASVAMQLGRMREAWQLRRRVFDDATALGDALLIERVLHEAARDELNSGRNDTAAALFDAELMVPTAAPRLRVDALLRRALIDSDPERLTELRRSALALADPALRSEALDDLRLAEGVAIRRRDPNRSVQLLSQCIDFRRSRQMRFSLASVFVERAATYRALARNSDAKSDYQAAITEIELQRARIPDENIRDAYLADERAYVDAFDFYVATGDHARAFDVTERSRARLFTERAGMGEPRHPAEISRSVRPGTVVIEYTIHGSDITIYTFSRRGFTAHVTHGSADAYDGLRALTEARRRDDADALDNAAMRLFDSLIQPIAGELAAASNLIVVNDNVTTAVPFCLLRNRATGRYLAEDMIIAFAPTASMVRQASESAVHRQAQVAVIADPAFDATRFPGLPRLEQAVHEARAIASLYAGTTITSGAAATRERVLRAMSVADVIHVAAHAVADKRDPRLSMIPLTPTANDAGVLYAADVTRLRLDKHPDVVLAGCRTAASAMSNQSVRSLALAFLAAGSRSATGTLWDVDDYVAREFSLRFHKELAAGVSPATALHNAQVAMLRSADPRLRSPITWGAFEVYSY